MSKLEEAVERKKKQDAEAAKAAAESKAEEERKKERDRIRGFKQGIHEHFAKLLDMVDVKIGDSRAEFEHKGERFYISFDFWESEPIGVDDYYMSGHTYTLHRDKPYSGEEFSLDRHDDKRIDRTDEVIEGIQWFDNAASRNKWR